uniref:Protein PMR5-like n=1 Tax=Nicotiana sylvestris TaxID=4096 RepID=A0A1U7W4L1_NICSY|nr:PREDICTED: protein PMR5-like [Nicotiana sylvestris]
MCFLSNGARARQSFSVCCILLYVGIEYLTVLLPLLHERDALCILSFSGVSFDETYPLYQSSSCPAIDVQFNCQLYDRPDTEYLKYRWKLANCELLRFNGLEFLLKMKGKTVMFVGDSLGRDQWESLICLISADVSKTQTQLSKS